MNRQSHSAVLGIQSSILAICSQARAGTKSNQDLGIFERNPYQWAIQLLESSKVSQSIEESFDFSLFCDI